MKSTLRILVLLALLCSICLPTERALAAPNVAAFTIINVTPNVSITIQTINMPAQTSFDVLMSPFNAQGVEAIKAGQVTSGPGGAFTATFGIPAALQGEYQIAVRLQSTANPSFFIHNWFYNNRYNNPNIAPPLKPGVGGLPAQPGKPLPTISITSVKADQSVTVLTHNFPAQDKMEVLMGRMGTRGVGGMAVDLITTGDGGSLSFTFPIPPALHGQYQIAIRIQSVSGRGYFAYNWFTNANVNTPGPFPGPIGPQPLPGYGVFPTFSVLSAARDGAVAIMAYNLPKNKPFQATMGLMGTRGMNGIVVSTFNTGAGGAQAFTFAIPPALFGVSPIAIRLQATDQSGYYAYNWFYNR